MRTCRDLGFNGEDGLRRLAGITARIIVTENASNAAEKTVFIDALLVLKTQQLCRADHNYPRGTVLSAKCDNQRAKGSNWIHAGLGLRLNLSVHAGRAKDASGNRSRGRLLRDDLRNDAAVAQGSSRQADADRRQSQPAGRDAEH